MDYATGKEEYSSAQPRQQLWKKQPHAVPFVSPRTETHPYVPLSTCHHEPCCGKKNEEGSYVRQGPGIRHGSYCNGERPRWECHLVLRLLSPGILMEGIANQCRTVILASGSLAPLPSLCAELNLYGPATESLARSPLSQNLPNSLSPVPGAGKGPQPSLTQKSPAPPNFQSPNGVKGASQAAKPRVGRLQTAPKPLEANHVVDLPKQLYAVAVGNFPDGSPLTVSYSNYNQPSFFPRLGDAIATVIESIPFGGVLVFLPSYSFLNKCVKSWNPNVDDNNRNGTFGSSPSEHSCFEIWHRLIQSKGLVIVEPTGNQEKFEAARAEYAQKIKKDGKCVLLAVFRGKMSEGISFNDNNARCVICVGLPYPNAYDRNIKAKKVYNDEQRKLRHNHHLLSGTEWYSQQAYRAIAQALGRCIRHGADYGSVVLMDSRHCDDGAPNLDDGICRTHRNLPKWMRHHMRTLSMRPSRGAGHNPVLGGYPGMKRELQSFFLQAPLHSKAVLEEWRTQLEQAQIRSRELADHTFDGTTGKWTSRTATMDSKSVVGVKAET
jgi:hypothetical protein